MWFAFVALAVGFLIALILVLAEIERRSFVFPAHQPASDFYAHLGRPLLGFFNSWIKLTHPQRPFHLLSDFPNAELFEKNADAIAAEARAIYSELGDRLFRFHELDEAQRKISNEKWKTFVLKWYSPGVLEQNSKRAPVTTSLIQQCPEITLAMFSILEPRARIPPHYGPNKACLRYHLPLVVPADRQNCWIKVDGEKRSWEYGKGMLFDDTYMHEVHNDTDDMRIVLFMDVRRPMSGLINTLAQRVLRWTGFLGYVVAINRKAEKTRSTVEAA
jgi:beta-hydroxylase